jgi:hypothetical protein
MMWALFLAVKTKTGNKKLKPETVYAMADGKLTRIQVSKMLNQSKTEREASAV